MPAVVPAIGLGISAFSAWRNSRAAGKAGAAQNALLGEQAASARMGRGLGYDMVQRGMPATSSALNYYAKLLQGNRATMAQAVAGPTRQITDVYRGAEASLERQGVRGGVRETALAELSRDRAASIAGLTTGVQGQAADRLADIGSALSAQGMAGISGAGGQFGAAAQGYGQQATEFRGAGREDMAGAGKSFGELLKIILQRRGGNSLGVSGDYRVQSPF